MRVTQIAVVAVALMLTISATRAADPCAERVFRFDGACHNLAHPTWGMANTTYTRREPVRFGDGISTPRAGPNPRTVSNVVALDDTSFGNPNGLNLFFVFAGQLFAHVVTALRTAAEANKMLILIEDPSDAFYGLSTVDPPALQMSPSIMVENEDEVPTPVNGITHWIDLSAVYGSSDEHVARLRSLEGGRLITSNYTIDGTGFKRPSITVTDQLPNAARVGIAGDPDLILNNPPESIQIAGDGRAIENNALLTHHLMWFREHNRFADAFAAANPGWTDQQLFESAMKWTIATYQNVQFYEFLRAVAGEVVFSQLAPYPGYDEEMDGRMSVAFTTLAFRFGHSMLPDAIPIIDVETSQPIGELPVTSLFHTDLNPLTSNLITRGPTNMAYSLLMHGGRRVDGKISDTMRNFHGSVDILAFNLQRERAHGLPAFNELMQHYHPDGADANLYTRQGCNEGDEFTEEDDSVACFMTVGGSSTIAKKLQEVYGKVKHVDSYLGMLLEHKPADSLLGITQLRVFIDQMYRSRAGDFWWFENTENGWFTPAEIATIKARKLADVISDNLGVPRDKINDFAFVNRVSGR